MWTTYVETKGHTLEEITRLFETEEPSQFDGESTVDELKEQTSLYEDVLKRK